MLTKREVNWIANATAKRIMNYPVEDGAFDQKSKYRKTKFKHLIKRIAKRTAG